jgi:hypothetical protein
VQSSFVRSQNDRARRGKQHELSNELEGRVMQEGGIEGEKGDEGANRDSQGDWGMTGRMKNEQGKRGWQRESRLRGNERTAQKKKTKN